MIRKTKSLGNGQAMGHTLQNLLTEHNYKERSVPMMGHPFGVPMLKERLNSSRGCLFKMLKTMMLRSGGSKHLRLYRKSREDQWLQFSCVRHGIFGRREI
ncbi:hypothetical protein BAE44_0012282 [Dichanthelium oligosanthes]|uniref:Uncharacterized protein n=1 Tax=Dichanthelium oligosanthes TaxID=888268 RepID=A0A1E5VNJ0_9POAL|nr:hypothetical protein BAE44_0012282 [Dichanthelium oligosanthes]